MGKRNLAVLLTLAFLAAPFKPVFAFECEVIEVKKKEVIIQCDENQVKSNGIKVKNKIQIKKLKK
jgi:hypothetical protein